MNRKQNKIQSRQRGKRYNPGRSASSRRVTVILALIFCLISGGLGAGLGIGIFNIMRDDGGDTFGTVAVLSPDDINGQHSGDGMETSITRPSKDKKLICIDPGHGLGDVGAESRFTSTKEYEINQAFSDKLREELIKRGFEVIYTHDGESFPEQYDYDKDGIFDELSKDSSGIKRSERRDFAQTLRPDMFISVHCNTFGDDERVGGMVFYYDSDNTASGKICTNLVSGMSAVETKFSPVYRTKSEGYAGEDAYTLTAKWNGTPAVLAELGYMTNEKDILYLENSEWLTAVSVAYADAIKDYYS